MASERCELLREGFLDVKFPPDSPERVLHKAWRKLWIRALVLHPSKREPSLILHVSRGPQDQQFQSLKVSRDGLHLFRCRSGSRPLQTWAVSSGTSLIVYLAAENEKETQSWMQTIRDGLWPSIQNMTEICHDVSLIDDEKTFSTGILGLYGRLVKTSDGMISIIHPHWQGVLLRWKQEDVVNIQLVRKVGDETSHSGVFKITLKSSKTETRTFYFYSNTAMAAIDWLRSGLIDSKELSTNKKSQSADEKLHHHENFNDNINKNNDTSVYATVRKVNEQLDKDSNTIDCRNIDKTLNDKLHANNFLSTNISSDLLDASLNFAKLPQTNNAGLQNDQVKLPAKSDDDSGDDSSDMYEHLYEVMVPKTSRSPTLYDDIQNTESEYVPPLPPPLPREKPKILRLLKLSESVAEALKLAEEPPSSVIDRSPKSNKRNNPIKDIAPSQLLDKKPILRRLSEPNIIR